MAKAYRSNLQCRQKRTLREMWRDFRYHPPTIASQKKSYSDAANKRRISKSGERLTESVGCMFTKTDFENLKKAVPKNQTRANFVREVVLAQVEKNLGGQS